MRRGAAVPGRALAFDACAHQGANARPGTNRGFRGTNRGSKRMHDPAPTGALESLRDQMNGS